MIHYRISGPQSHRHFIHLEAHIPSSKSELRIQIPSWRPGRYEIGDFAKYIREWSIQDDNGKAIPFKKIRKDLWHVDSGNSNKVIVRYTFYASILNAGSTFLDEQMLYMNPVNCLLYDPDNQDQGYRLELDIPSDYEVATSLKKDGKHTLLAENVQEMMDSPFIASADLEHHEYDAEGAKFHIWIQGNHPLNISRMKSEFENFTKAQIQAFGGIPVPEYHFLFHLLPYRSYHGVEHEASTVITLGPAVDLQKKSFYDDLLGVSCHELYHTWNIKSIRPIEMMPYDFSRENYTKLGYVAEGVTTYFGDQFLHRSGVFTDEDYFIQLGRQLQKHFDNPGRFNHSVSESSFDTWLDGYVPGIPWRKVSIYVEGCLAAFLCDVKIIRSTRGSKSLDDVMKIMYERFGLKGIGYSEQDYKSVLEEVSGDSFDDIFNSIIWGKSDFRPLLNDSFEYLGMEVLDPPSVHYHEAAWGIKVDHEAKIIGVLPDSPADKAGLWYDDKIWAVNGLFVGGNLESISRAAGEGTIRINLLRNGILIKRELSSQELVWYKSFGLKKKDLLSEEQHKAFDFWKSR